MTRLRDERGSLSILVLVVLAGLTLVIGLVVEGSGKAQAAQRAESIAGQAARVAGQVLDGTAAVRGGGATLDTAAAAQAARDYLNAANVRGAITVVGNRVDITVNDTYHTRLLQVVGVTSLEVTGRATAESYLVRNGKIQ